MALLTAIAPFLVFILGGLIALAYKKPQEHEKLTNMLVRFALEGWWGTLLFFGGALSLSLYQDIEMTGFFALYVSSYAFVWVLPLLTLLLFLLMRFLGYVTEQIKS
ncbi:hypothetical protein [Thalassotalea eurytherma]|uniref:Uncharacterized protein n=1 Tax=Thalassotalea eurytherma TaxID=1144278 RepID=A0ABQ6GYA1_9GAMM|nr:hypothetical protein [Thalassotalea eurytherma]GLX80895.1 hypothetical protein theurythT_03470 [Thalassotalea eurytherma]